MCCREYKEKPKREQRPVDSLCSCPDTLQCNVVPSQFIKIHSFAIKSLMCYSSSRREILKRASDLFTIKHWITWWPLTDPRCTNHSRGISIFLPSTQPRLGARYKKTNTNRPVRRTNVCKMPLAYVIYSEGAVVLFSVIPLSWTKATQVFSDGLKQSLQGKTNQVQFASQKRRKY